MSGFKINDPDAPFSSDYLVAYNNQKPISVFYDDDAGVTNKIDVTIEKVELPQKQQGELHLLFHGIESSSGRRLTIATLSDFSDEVGVDTIEFLEPTAPN